ncbi:MAG TPA: hypothetical protein DCP92_06250 [Nitrospiraceae bacterium]|nr:hypothetical protein [Nitrospiraceae bacterium]
MVAAFSEKYCGSFLSICRDPGTQAEYSSKQVFLLSVLFPIIMMKQPPLALPKCPVFIARSHLYINKGFAEVCIKKACKKLSFVDILVGYRYIVNISPPSS